MEVSMNKTLIASSVLALSLLAVPAMAQGYYRYYEAPITGAQMTDFPSARVNTTRTGSMLSIGSHYDKVHRDFTRERDYDRYDAYRYHRHRDRYGDR
jgi:hypothetical protein